MMGRACEARVASMTCASTGRSPRGSSNLCRPAPMRLELPAARIIAAVVRGMFKRFLLLSPGAGGRALRCRDHLVTLVLPDHERSQFRCRVLLGQWGIDNHLQVRLLRHGEDGWVQCETTNQRVIDFVEAATVQNNLMLSPPGAKLRASLPQLSNQLVQALIIGILVMPGVQ